jgi:hypothetical protein
MMRYDSCHSCTCPDTHTQIFLGVKGKKIGFAFGKEGDFKYELKQLVGLIGPDLRLTYNASQLAKRLKSESLSPSYLALLLLKERLGR